MKEYDIEMSSAGYLLAILAEIPPGISFDKIVEDLKEVKRQLPQAPDVEHVGYKSQMLHDYLVTTYGSEWRKIPMKGAKKKDKYAVKLNEFGRNLLLPSNVYIFAIRYNAADNDEILVMRLSSFVDKEVADITKKNGVYSSVVTDPVSFVSQGKYELI